MGDRGLGDKIFSEILKDADFQKIGIFLLGALVGGAVLASLDLLRFVPTALAFGLLWFGVGIVLMEFVALWRKRAEFERSSREGLELWKQEFGKLEDEKAKWEEEKEGWEEARDSWEKN